MTTNRARLVGAALGYLVLVVGAVLYLGPFLIQVATSFKSNADAVAHPLSLVPEQIYTSSYERIATDPAVNVPLYWNAEGLPIGVMLAGRLGGEDTLISLSAQLEEARPWIDRKPPIWNE